MTSISTTQRDELTEIRDIAAAVITQPLAIPQDLWPEQIALALNAAGYAKVDHVEYAADHKYSSLEFTDEDGCLFTDRDDFERTFEEYGNATLMQRTVGPWVPLEPEAEATR